MAEAGIFQIKRKRPAPRMRSILRLCEVCGYLASNGYGNDRLCVPCIDFFRDKTESLNLIGMCQLRGCDIEDERREDRCVFCHYKKCLEAGMSMKDVIQRRDFGTERTFEYDREYTAYIKLIYKKYVKVDDIVSIARRTASRRVYASGLFCPINMKSWVDPQNAHQFCDKFAYLDGIKKFFKGCPGMKEFSKADAIQLMRARMFPVLFIRLASLFVWADTLFYLYCLNGKTITNGECPFNEKTQYMEFMFKVANKVKELRLSNDDMAIFSFFILVNSQTFKMQNPIKEQGIEYKAFILLRQLCDRHPERETLFDDLLNLSYDLTQLNFLHKTNYRLRVSAPSNPSRPKTPISTICEYDNPYFTFLYRNSYANDHEDRLPFEIISFENNEVLLVGNYPQVLSLPNSDTDTAESESPPQSSSPPKSCSDKD